MQAQKSRGKKKYHDLSSWLLRRSRHGPFCVLGDFNARIHKRFASDPACVGPYVFGNPNACMDSGSNRSLLLEVCQACNLSVANAFFNHEPRKQVTCYDIGSNPGSALTWKHFRQIEMVLVSHDWLDTLTQLFSCMEHVLALHHFLVLAKLSIQVPKLGR